MATINIKRFPENLYKILQKLAELDRRSLAQEIIYLLQTAVEETKKPSILELRGLGKKQWKDVDVTNHINLERDAWE